MAFAMWIVWIKNFKARNTRVNSDLELGNTEFQIKIKAKIKHSLDWTREVLVPCVILDITR